MSFQEHSLSETSGFAENNSESDFKTLSTLKSFLGIISDVRIGNVLIFIFFDISIIMSPPSAIALLSAAIPSFSHRLSFDPFDFSFGGLGSVSLLLLTLVSSSEYQS